MTWTIASVSVSLSKTCPLAVSSALQLAEVLDDAVVHDRDLAVHVRMRVALGRRPCVAQRVCSMPVWAVERLLQEAPFEIAQLAFGAAALQAPVLHRGDAG